MLACSEISPKPEKHVIIADKGVWKNFTCQKVYARRILFIQYKCSFQRDKVQIYGKNCDYQ